MSLIYKGINVAILLLLVFWFLKKKMQMYFQQQRDDLDRSMKLAAAEYEKIEGEFKGMEERIKNLDSQLADMRKNNEAAIQKDIQRLRSDAEALTQKMASETEQRMDRELEKTKEIFTSDLIEAALAGARAELNSKMLKQDESWTVKMVSDGMNAEKASRERANYAS